MLDLFTVFTKSGIELCHIENDQRDYKDAIDSLIVDVILQAKENASQSFQYENSILHYKLDNEYGIVFVVVYQNILKLTYVDRFLNDVSQAFKSKFISYLQHKEYFKSYNVENEYEKLLHNCEQDAQLQAKAPKAMRTFEQSHKSKKTVASLIEQPQVVVKQQQPVPSSSSSSPQPIQKSELTEEVLMANRAKLAQKMMKKSAPTKKTPKSPQQTPKSGKAPRVWEFGGTEKDAEHLERTSSTNSNEEVRFNPQMNLIGTMRGDLRDLDEDVTNTSGPEKKSRFLSIFQDLVGGGGKPLQRFDMEHILEKMRDHLIQKNVAADITEKLCESVANKLIGKQLTTFERVSNTVRNCMMETLVQILQPKRRIDLLRDCIEAKSIGRPYTIVFCGVNGVGKSTNLAKICFWLIENDLKVLIAACDTFRAGAVEQLRTHCRHLNALHTDNGATVQLYEKGYGKDAAGIAMEAIRYANEIHYDVVLIDTAGRMQDNEPLMRALTKLIKVNEPDLVLFVGEALVGNEAVDQLVKFNQALADFSATQRPHLIDGIVLTKFDTIDDKVGAAISMTYVTGQPIVFVGTGQTYTDLKALNPKAIVQTLIK